MKEPEKELAGTDFEFTFTPIYETTWPTRGHKNIIRFRFELKKGPVLKDIPTSWLEHADTGSIITRLREWKVTDANIVKYAPILKQQGALELLKAWKLKIAPIGISMISSATAMRPSCGRASRR